MMNCVDKFVLNPGIVFKYNFEKYLSSNFHGLVYILNVIINWYSKLNGRVN